MEQKEFCLDKGQRLVINVDFDGTLTTHTYQRDPIPDVEHCEIIRKLYYKGYIIIIHTARPWEEAPEVVGWLIKNHVPYQGIFMMKGGSDCYYCDDKNITWDDLKAML